MNINIYTGFSKKKNSTKVPTGTGTAVTASLKRQTSYHNPVFVLSPVTGVSMEDISYIKYGSHYYFVTDITVVPNNVYEISCAEDPMATHRSEILGSSQYVIYSASNTDPMIADPRILAEKNDYHFVSAKLQDGGSDFVLDTIGCFVLTACSANYGNYFVTNYLIDHANLRALAKYLFDKDEWLPNFWTGGLDQLFLNAYESIISVLWVPINFSEVTTGATPVVVQLGKDNISIGGVNVEGYVLPGDARKTYSGSLTHTWHYKDDWRLAPPYTTAKLYVPGYGIVDINPCECKGGIYVQTTVDVLTGDALTDISGDGLISIATLQYNLGINIPIAQMTPNAMGGIAQIASGIAMAGSGGAAAAVAGAATAVKGTVDLFNSTPSYKGGLGGKSWFTMPYYGIKERYIDTRPLNEFNTTNGQPLFKQVTLSTLSGYCKCENASVSIAGYDSDRDYINNVLNSGFFIE